MRLQADTSRCLGLLPGLDGEQRCTRRQECARYQQRWDRGEATPMVQYLCPGKDDYWQGFIQGERNDS